MTAELVKSRALVLTFMGIFLSMICSAQNLKLWKINQVDSLMQAAPKPLLILLSTDWCKYCQMQKNQLLKNKEFQQKSNQFYYVEFDAESKAPITFQDTSFVYRPTGAKIGTHELAFHLNGSHKLSFPTWVLLDSTYQPILRYNGVLLKKQLSAVLEKIQTMQ